MNLHTDIEHVQLAVASGRGKYERAANLKNQVSNFFFLTSLVSVWCLFLQGTSETELYHRDLMDNDEVPYNYDNAGIVRKSNNLRIREKPSPPFRTISRDDLIS